MGQGVGLLTLSTLRVGLFFYFPRMLPVQRVWITLICEHVLLLLKLLVDTVCRWRAG